MPLKRPLRRRRPTSRKSGRRVVTEGPRVAAASYRGPANPSSNTLELDTSVRALTDTGSVAATAGGVINTAFSSDPTAMVQWTSISGQYDEYRVLAMELWLIPFNYNNQTLSVAYALSQGVMFTCLDMNSSTAITSAQNAAEFASMKPHPGAVVIKRTAKASGFPLMEYQDTNASPGRVFSIKLRGDGYFASATHYQYVVRRLIQFRGTI